MEDYEIVNASPVQSIEQMLPVCKVKTAGEMVADFAEKKLALQEFMKVRYGELVVDENTITAIKKDLAELRKIEREIGSIIKKAKEDFNKPIELTIKQAEEFKKVVTDTITDLASKQKVVDEGIQQKNLAENMKLYEFIAEEYDQDVKDFAKECEGWIVKEQWKNKTYTNAQVKADVKSAFDNIKFALQIFQGKYRAQALDRFKRSGNLAEAQSFVSQMEEADAKEAERQKRIEAMENTMPATPSAPTVEPVMAPEQMAIGVPSRFNDEKIEVSSGDAGYTRNTIEVSSPDSYLRTEEDKAIKTFNISIKAPSGVIEWLKELLIIPENTTYKVITNSMILSAAEVIKQRIKEKENA